MLWNHGGSSDAIDQAGLRYTVTVLSPAGRYFTGLLDLVHATAPAARRLALGSDGRLDHEERGARHGSAPDFARVLTRRGRGSTNAGARAVEGQGQGNQLVVVAGHGLYDADGLGLGL